MTDEDTSTQPSNVGVWLGIIIGTSIAGPGGAAVGGLVGATIEGLTGNILGNLASNGITALAQRVRHQFSPQEQQISRNLQTTFRTAFQNAVYDIGGRETFPQPWKHPRSVPVALSYRSTPGGQSLVSTDPDLAARMDHLLREIDHAVVNGQLLPITFSDTASFTRAQTYIENTTPRSLSEDFYDNAVAPFLNDQFASLMGELRTFQFEGHLRQNILVRTLVHMEELLRRDAEAWRAFERIVLEQMRDAINSVGSDQQNIATQQQHVLAQIDELLSRPPNTALLENFSARLDEIGQQLRREFQTIPAILRLEVTEPVTDALAGMEQRISEQLQDARSDIASLRPTLKTFIPKESFFAATLNPTHLFNHAIPFIGREILLERLDTFIGSVPDLAILKGRGGIGKTRLLLAFAEQLQQRHPDLDICFIAEGVPITPESANELPDAPCLIVADDAHRRDDLHILFAIMQQRTQPTKGLLAIRPQAIDHLNSLLSQAHVDIRQILYLDELRDLTRDEVRALARNVLGADQEKLIDQLAAVTRDSPLVTVIGGRLLAERQISPHLLERDDEFRYAVLSRFEDILVGSVHQQINHDLCRALLKLIAILSPLRDENRLVEAVAAFLKTDQATVMKALDVLEQAAVLLRRGYSLRITPDVLSDHILHNACVTSGGQVTGYAQEIFEQFAHLVPSQILSNLAELDWRIHQTTVQAPDALASIWQVIVAGFQEASHAGRCRILDSLKDVAFYQPERVLEIVTLAIREPAAPVEDEAPQWFTHDQVLQKLPPLLQRIGYNLDYLQRCCDILWQLGRDDARPTNSNPNHGMRILQDFAQYDIGKYYVFNEGVLESVNRWLRRDAAHSHLHSPLEVLDQLMAKSGHSDYSEGYCIVMRPFLVSYEETRLLRERALDLIADCAQSADTKVVLRAIQSLENALQPPRAYFNMQISEEARKQWLPEEQAVLELFAGVAQASINPVVHLRIIKTLAWHTRHNPSNEIRQRTREIIASIPDTYELRLIKILSHAYGRIWLLDNEGSGARLDHAQREQKKQTVINALVKEFIETHSDPTEGLQYIHTKLEEIQADGARPAPLDFAMALSQSHPQYAAAMAEALIENPDNHLAPYIAWLLFGLRRADIDTTLALEQHIASRGNATLAFSLTHAFRWEQWRAALQPADVEVLQSLLGYPDPNVSTQAVSVMGYVGQILPDLVIPIALSIEVGDSPVRAEALCRVFHKDHGIHHEKLTDEQLELLLSKLELVKEIGDYDIREVLGYMALRFPRRMVEFLIQRIRHGKASPDANFEPLPLDGLGEQLTVLADSEQYSDLLRLVRDSALDEATHHSRELSVLYKAMSLNYQVASLAVLKEWIDSGDEQKITLASMLLREASLSFIFENENFTMHLLEQAYSVDTECYNKVQGHLASTVLDGSRSETAGEPFPQDILLQDQAHATLERLSQSSPLRGFYEMLLCRAEAHIADSQRRDEEFDG
ncbi:ATP-binding protein [Candidatus Chloroploca sp. Khr17]|uniref:ATP-binding protein n=1 Tax=Candidatus Chloroploca sp. Khr17 TaxID=2496869 RepID=UPI00101C4B3A|nr:ATP-binding protein [Candidatus Chloroploca sp. Khr17]